MDFLLFLNFILYFQMLFKVLFSNQDHLIFTHVLIFKIHIVKVVYWYNTFFSCIFLNLSFVLQMPCMCMYICEENQCGLILWDSYLNYFSRNNSVSLRAILTEKIKDWTLQIYLYIYMLKIIRLTSLSLSLCNLCLLNFHFVQVSFKRV